MRFYPALFLLMSLFISGCGSEPETVEVEVSDLEGRWELVEARRDNVKTGVLDGLYYVFGPDGGFETNLLTGEAQRGSYTREGEEISTTGVEPAMTYEVLALEGDRLMLRSRYQGFLFDFALQRAGGAEPEE